MLISTLTNLGLEPVYSSPKDRPKHLLNPFHNY